MTGAGKIEDSTTNSSSTLRRNRTETNNSSKIELEEKGGTHVLQAEFAEDITRQRTNGSLLNEQEKPHLKRSLKARHVSLLFFAPTRETRTN